MMPSLPSPQYLPAPLNLSVKDRVTEPAEDPPAHWSSYMDGKGIDYVEGDGVEVKVAFRLPSIQAAPSSTMSSDRNKSSHYMSRSLRRHIIVLDHDEELIPGRVRRIELENTGMVGKITIRRDCDHESLKKAIVSAYPMLAHGFEYMFCAGGNKLMAHKGPLDANALLQRMNRSGTVYVRKLLASGSGASSATTQKVPRRKMLTRNRVEHTEARGTDSTDNDDSLKQWEEGRTTPPVEIKEEPYTNGYDEFPCHGECQCKCCPESRQSLNSPNGRSALRRTTEYPPHDSDEEDHMDDSNHVSPITSAEFTKLGDVIAEEIHSLKSYFDTRISKLEKKLDQVIALMINQTETLGPVAPNNNTAKMSSSAPDVYQSGDRDTADDHVDLPGNNNSLPSDGVGDGDLSPEQDMVMDEAEDHVDLRHTVPKIRKRKPDAPMRAELPKKSRSFRLRTAIK